MIDPAVEVYNGMAWTWRNGAGYNIFSGDVGNLSIVAGVVLWLRSRNCHVRGCPRLCWHPHPKHGHPVCRRHHPHGADDLAEGVRMNPHLNEEDHLGRTRERDRIDRIKEIRETLVADGMPEDALAGLDGYIAEAEGNSLTGSAEPRP